MKLLSGRDGRSYAQQLQEVAADQLLVLIAAEHRLYPGLDGLGHVQVGDANGHLYRLDDRVVGDAVAVWQAATAYDSRLFTDAAEELGDQTRLPNAGWSKDREELTYAVLDRGLEPLSKQGKLPIAPDHR